MFDIFLAHILHFHIRSTHRLAHTHWFHLFDFDSNFLTKLFIFFLQSINRSQLWHILLNFFFVDKIMIKQIHLAGWIENFVKLDDIVLNH